MIENKIIKVSSKKKNIGIVGRAKENNYTHLHIVIDSKMLGCDSYDVDFEMSNGKAFTLQNVELIDNYVVVPLEDTVLEEGHLQIQVIGHYASNDIKVKSCIYNGFVEPSINALQKELEDINPSVAEELYKNTIRVVDEFPKNPKVGDIVALRKDTKDEYIKGFYIYEKEADNSYSWNYYIFGGGGGVDIANNSITTSKIKDSAITKDKIANNAITTDKIALQAVSSRNVADKAITPGKLDREYATPTYVNEKIEGIEVSWNDLKDRPFGEINEIDEINFDGIITDNLVVTEPVELYGQQISLVKIAELSIPAKDFILKIKSIHANEGTIFDEEQIYNSIVDDEGISAFVLLGQIPIVVAVEKENTTINGFTYPEAGVYIVYSLYPDNSIMFVNRILFNNLVKIEEKYMPLSYDEIKDDIDWLKNNAKEQVQSDYEENNENEISYIKNRPFYSTQKFKDIENIPNCIDFSDLSYVWAEVTKHNGDELQVNDERYIKVSDLYGDIDEVFEEISSIHSVLYEYDIINPTNIKTENYIGVFRHSSLGISSWAIFLVKTRNSIHKDSYYNILFPETGIYICYTSGDTSEGLRLMPIITKIKFNGELKKLDNEFLYIDEASKKDSKNPIASGVVYDLEAQIKDNKKKIKEINDDYVTNQQIDTILADFEEIRENVNDIVDDFEAINESIDDIKANSEEIDKDVANLNNEVLTLKEEPSIIQVKELPVSYKYGKIVALLSDREEGIDKFNIPIKSRGDIQNVEISEENSTKLEHLKVSSLEKNQELLYNAIWAVYDLTNLEIFNGVQIGIIVYDKTFTNGLKFFFDTTYFMDGFPYIKLTKIRNNIDTDVYYCITEDAYNENYEPVIDKMAGWYKKIEEDYIELTENELNSIVENFDEAFLLDYWITQSKEDYINNGGASGINVYRPSDLIPFLGLFLSIEAKKGFYKFNNSSWERWDIVNSNTDVLTQVQPDWSQNDPTKPDYVKNRIAYYGKKFDDMEAIEYEEPTIANLTVYENGTSEGEAIPYMIKINELPDKTTPAEVVEEIIGYSLEGTDYRFDNLENFSPEDIKNLKVEYFGEDVEGNYRGSILLSKNEPILAVINTDEEITYSLTITEEDKDTGEIYSSSWSMNFNVPGIYALIVNYDEDDEGNITKYYSFDKILFRDTKKIDKALLPLEALAPWIELDNNVSSASEKAITSKAVHTALQNKIDKPYFDSVNEGYVFGVQNGELQLFYHPVGIQKIEFDAAINKKMDNISVTFEDNGKILMVVEGKWKASDINWNNIKDKPKIVDGIVMNSTDLVTGGGIYNTIKNFVRKEELNQLLDSFAALLDTANREVL